MEMVTCSSEVMRAQLSRAFRWFGAGETASSFGSWIPIPTPQLIVFGGICLRGFVIGLSNSHETVPAVIFALTAIGLWFSLFRTVRMSV